MRLAPCEHFATASPVGLAAAFISFRRLSIPSDSEACPSTLTRRLVLDGLLRAARLWALSPFGTSLYLIHKQVTFAILSR